MLLVSVRTDSLPACRVILIKISNMRPHHTSDLLCCYSTYVTVKSMCKHLLMMVQDHVASQEIPSDPVVLSAS